MLSGVLHVASPAAPPGATALTLRQLIALFSLRRRMVRSRRMRVALGAAAALLPMVLALGVWSGASRADDPQAHWMVPALFASVAVVAVLAPLAAGGGYQLFPDDHLVAFPIRPGAVAGGSLLLSPLNLTWLAQVVGVATATGYLTGTGPRLALAVLTTTVYVALACVAGAALSWAVTGARARRGGRLAVGGLGVVLGLGAWSTAATGRGEAALDRLPTTWVIDLVAEAWAGSVARWATGFTVLLLGTAVAAAATVRMCAWTLNRPPQPAAARGAAVPVRRRAPRHSVFAALVAVDRASVWRAAPLRRGVLMLATVPGAAAAVAGVEWTSIVMLPGIVAAGTGLLFGINVFCLDGGGAVWLATQPHDPRLAYLAKARVLTELCLLTSTTTVLVAATRARGTAHAADVSAVLGALLLGPALVVAACMAISVHRPHRADLRGPRDTPVPPGSMFASTVVLSVAATVAGAVLAAFSLGTGRPAAPLLVAVGLAGPAILSIWRGSLRWRDPARRARVVTAVSAG